MTWDGVRGTLQWFVLLLLVAVITAAGVAAHWWAQKDQLIARVVLTQLKDVLPQCESSFEALRIVDSAHLELTQLSLRTSASNARLLHIPRVVVEIDPGILQQHRRIVVRKLTVHSPEIWLMRGPDNEWNWSGVELHPPATGSSPDWVIRNGVVRVGFQSPAGYTLRALTCQGIQLALEPESHRRYSIRGEGVAEALGPFRLSGLVDGISGEWNIAGTAGEVRLGDPLLDLAGRLAPQIEQQIARLRASNQSLMAQTRSRQPVRTASTGETSDAADAGEPASQSLLRADVSLEFSASQSESGSPLTYFVSGSVDNGHISELLLPVPLYNLEGSFRLAPDLVEVHDLKASNGPSTLYVDGTAKRENADWTKDFAIRATQLQLDERIRGFLWGSLADIFDLLRPSGTFDIDLGIAQQANAPLKWSVRKLAARDCRVICDYFQYPVENVQGEISQHDQRFHVALQGNAHGQPLTVTGDVVPASPEKTIDLTVAIDECPVDERIGNALRRPEQAVIRDILDDLQLSGTARDVRVRIVRNDQTAGEVLICLAGHLHDGRLNYSGFPYEITGLSGKLTYDPLVRDSWIFEELSGRHGNARLAGRGVFDLETTPGQLAVELAALQVPLDHDLRKACTTAEADLDAIWRDFELQGLVDIQRVDIRWKPDVPVHVGLHGMHWTNGQVRPAAFPYPWKNVDGNLDWDGQRLTIHSLHADHGETYLMLNGTGESAAYVDIAPTPEIAWRLHADNLRAIKLNPDDEFKRAVPVAIADALSAVQLQGTVDLKLRLDMKGWTAQSDLVTASWSVQTTLRENRLVTGVPVDNVTGTINVHQGSWDGQHLAMEGFAEIEQLRTLGMPFRNIEGPFLVHRDRLAIGMPKLSGNEPVYHADNPYRQTSFQADLYGGQVNLDVEMSLAAGTSAPPYQLEVTASNVELGMWAREHQIDAQRLMGKVTGILQASGRGDSAMSTTGQGWIQITPAALYELPVMAQMFSILSFRPAQPGESAFNYAYGDFTVHDGQFDFSRIELVGEALRLAGRGTVGYAGPKMSNLNLDFYSMMPNRFGFLAPIVGALGDRWIRVQVFGTTTQPIAQIQPRIPVLDQAFGNFMQSQQAGPPRRPPPRGQQPTADRAPVRE